MPPPSLWRVHALPCLLLAVAVRLLYRIFACVQCHCVTVKTEGSPLVQKRNRRRRRSGILIWFSSRALIILSCLSAESFQPESTV